MDPWCLVVCPDQEAAGLLMLILSEIGMAAEHTTSITRGLELLDSQHYDAIVFDYRADPTSDEFLGRLRQSGNYRASLLIAVVASNFSARPLFGLGANFVLYRPLSSERTRISLRAARGLMRRERRRAPRALVSAPVTVAYPGMPEMKAFLTDLSDSGASIHSVNLPRACKGYFEFELPGQHDLVRLSGEVAWQDATGRTGIRFLNVPIASRRLIQAWLQRNQAHLPKAPMSRLPENRKVAPQTGHVSESDNEPKPVSRDPALVSNAGNRRGEHRFACRLGAEVYVLGNSVPNRCVLTDISEGGCYVEMSTPFVRHSRVEIVVRTADTKLVIRGQVLKADGGFGMGVRFEYRDTTEREEVLRLLAALSTGPMLNEQHR
jgi:hypothetical protein